MRTDQAAEQIANALAQVSDDGSSDAAVLLAAISLRERHLKQPMTPIIDQLVIKSGWLQRACRD